jgi:hypothetical protein
MNFREGQAGWPRVRSASAACGLLEVTFVSINFIEEHLEYIEVCIRNIK